jgi:hypothetical protein
VVELEEVSLLVLPELLVPLEVVEAAPPTLVLELMPVDAVVVADWGDIVVSISMTTKPITTADMAMDNDPIAFL